MADVITSQTVAVTRQTAVSIALVLVLIGAAIAGATQFTHLASEVAHLQLTLNEVKGALQELQGRQLSTTNANTLVLVLERMRQDDEREHKDTKALSDLLQRIIALESK